MADRACISIAGAYSAMSQQQQQQHAQLAAAQQPTAALATAAAGAGSGFLNCKPVPTYASREAYMAALCKQVAVDGFEPLSNVFSLKEW